MVVAVPHRCTRNEWSLRARCRLEICTWIVQDPSWEYKRVRRAYVKRHVKRRVAPLPIWQRKGGGCGVCQGWTFADVGARRL